MEIESVGDFALRLHGMGQDQPSQPTDTKTDPLGYLMNMAGVTKDDIYKGLLTNERAENWRQSVYRGVPSGIGAILGGAVGGTVAGASSMGIGTGAGLYVGAGSGAAGGEFLRQGLVGFNAALGNTQTPTAQQVALSGAKEGAINALVPMAAKPILASLGKTITGISAPAMDRLLNRPSQVASKAMLDPEAAPALAKQFVDLVNANMDRSGEAYRSLINKAVAAGGDTAIDLKSALMDRVASVRKDFGYGLPGRLAEENESTLFNKFANGISGLQSATPEQAYYLQRDMSNAIRSNVGKPIAAALSSLKSGVLDALDIALPEIKSANAIYRAGSELEENLSKVTNADSALSAIKAAIKNRGTTFDALRQAGDKIASGRQLLEAIQDASAGRELSPLISDMPRTGFTAGLGLLGYNAGLMGDPMARAAALGVAPFLSPRAMAYGTRAVMSLPGQMAARPALSGLVDQLTQMAGGQQQKQIVKPESVGDFALRLHGMGP